MKFIKYILFTYLLLFLGCKKHICENEAITSKIYNDIFYELIEGISKQDIRRLVVPSPSNIKEYLEDEAKPRYKESADKRKALIVVNDSIDPTVVLSKNEKDVFFNCKRKTVFYFSKLPYNKNIKIVSSSYYNKNKERLATDYFYIGSLALSKITIKENLKEGYLDMSLISNKLNAIRSKLIIKVVNGEWVICNVEIQSIA